MASPLNPSAKTSAKAAALASVFLSYGTTRCEFVPSHFLTYTYLFPLLHFYKKSSNTFRFLLNLSEQVILIFTSISWVSIAIARLPCLHILLKYSLHFATAAWRGVKFRRPAILFQRTDFNAVLRIPLHFEHVFVLNCFVKILNASSFFSSRQFWGNRGSSLFA